jgi:hypothetical protein
VGRLTQGDEITPQAVQTSGGMLGTADSPAGFAHCA